MSRYRLSPRAKRDLTGIRDWIGRDDPARAVTHVAEITARLEQLAAHPSLGRPRSEFGLDCRSALHGNFVIFYRPAAHGIDVLRVVHGRRDLRPGLP